MYIHIIIDLFSTQKKMQLFRGYNRQHHIPNVTWHTAPKNHYHLNCFPPSFWCKSMGNWRQKRPERPNFLPSGMTFVALSLVVAEDSEDWKSLSPLSPSWRIWESGNEAADPSGLILLAWKSSRVEPLTDVFQSWLFLVEKRIGGCSRIFVVRYQEKNPTKFPESQHNLPAKSPSEKNGRQIHHFETALQVVGALVAPKDLIFRLFLDSSFNKNSRKPSNMIHLGGANFFLAPEAPKKPTCSPQSILSIHPIAPLAWEKDPLRPKRKLRKFCLEMTPSWNPIRSWFLSRIWPLDGWRFFGRKAKNNWPTEAFYIRNSPTHLINILKLHWIGKQFDMECTNSKVR